MALKPNDKIVEFRNVTCIRETEAALLCEIEGEEHWIPKSQVHDDSEVFDDQDNSEGTLVVSQWIAKERRLM